MKAIPIKEAAELDPLVKEAMEKIARGELIAETPIDDVVWTEEDKRRLDEALAKVFGWK